MSPTRSSPTGILAGGLGRERLRAAYRGGEMTPVDVVAAVLDRIEARGEDAVWTARVPRAEALAAAAALDLGQIDRLPLFGLPFAVKDNIDVAGLPTTAACPEFGYLPRESAPLVDRLVAAGAILVGKNNLDQFATGLNGTRSPYGVPVNPQVPGLIPGGSSSGSAVAVAAGLVSFSIGTDTAGSGRVPAALTDIVGVKPSIGLVSATGIVPACRSLDCSSVFASSVADGAAVLAVLGGPDVADPWSRRLPVPAGDLPPLALAGLRLGVPSAISGWGTRGEQEAWLTCCARLVDAGVELVPLDLDELLEAGRELYQGAWVAERLSGLEEFLEREPAAVLPVIRTILADGAEVTGAEVFRALSGMHGRRARARALLADVDALLTPTVVETFTVEEMLADPISLNTRLGRFTTFTNLLDLCAVAVPVRPWSVAPFGVSVQAAAGRDEVALRIAAAIEGMAGVSPSGAAPVDGGLELAVVGAHLRGMPLHHELEACEAVFLERTTTAAAYELHALAGPGLGKPGLRRVASGGVPIEVEVYRLPLAEAGRFLAGVPAPLGIGQLELGDGRWVHGFVCEPIGFAGATDVSAYGGWRAFRTAQP
ncbi:allophanate hydrolase [Nocardioides cavernaquae]|uniref:Allophanate hydrolase n=1 Tax=Nocardioides cavernaquae TaxID=2321396 RepID=A0A3A5HAC8_9ACTN|nr:allophanate hydrolase [Nocardioides cavernaquae]RJS44990.1 allophanate hydrolase [Nocardioides cavernaquae]